MESPPTNQIKKILLKPLFLNNLSLVTIVKEKTLRPLSDNQADGTTKKLINWSNFSTEYSIRGLKEGLYLGAELEDLGEYVHRFWIEGLLHLWELLEKGYEVEGGYSKEKRASHKKMLVDYSELSREDQLKDLYTIKDLLPSSQWLELGGEFYEEEFKTFNIGW